MDGNPFIVFEAEVFVTVEDDNTVPGQSGIPVWFGGCAERIAMNTEPDETLVEYHGHPFRKARHGEEKHTIDLTNVWLLDVNTVSPVGAMGMPRLARNQRMTMVILWEDADTGYWNKRVYFGVTWRGQRINDLPLQEIPLRAERMVERSGLLNANTDPTALAEVLVVSGLGSVPVPIYSYDIFESTFTLADNSLTALGEIAAGADDISISVHGTPVLRADADGLFVNDLVVMGKPASTEVPRMEFQLNGEVVATLSASGLLSVGNVFETDESGLEAAAGFVLKDGSDNRLAVIGAKGVSALALSEFP